MNFFAVSESLSWNQYLDIWCQSQGVPRGKCDQASLEKFEQLPPPGGLGREFGENVLFAQEFGYEGCDCPANRGKALQSFPFHQTISDLTIHSAAWSQRDILPGIL
ncbi:hypothetical protein V1507DRAFT_76198 [Lipomyces tetrasporus]